MFRTVPPSIIRSFSLYTQQWLLCHAGLLTACEQDQDGTGFVLQNQTISILILLVSSQGVFHRTHNNGICQQTCMTYNITVCTVKNS